MRQAHFITPWEDFTITWLKPPASDPEKVWMRMDGDLGFCTSDRLGGLIARVPAGRVLDLSSVPTILSSLAGDWRKTSRPGAVHDELYRKRATVTSVSTGRKFSVTRRLADAIFDEALECEKVADWRRWLMVKGVRIGGASSFQKKDILWMPDGVGPG